MAGLYFHVPFCRKACIYCDFHFVTSLKSKGVMVAGMVKELELQNRQSTLSPFETIYFGGGTPSVLSPEELQLLLDTAQNLAGIIPFAEITLEANPDDLTLANLNSWKKLGINRLSVGIQAFDQLALQWMNRSHRVEDIEAGIERARAAGFGAFNMDLIFGWPGLTTEKWQEQLDKMVALQPEHISVYGLSVESKTALAHQVKLRQVMLPGDEAHAAQFLQAHAVLESAGYQHYEISNYARPGSHSRHNTAYWQGKPYLGIGPSAHSFDGDNRWWNISNNARYLHSLEENLLPVAEKEALTLRDRYHEYLMTGLRQALGVSIGEIEQRFFPDWEKEFGAIILTQIEAGRMKKSDSGQISLTPEGWLVSDSLISELFISAE